MLETIKENSEEPYTWNQQKQKQEGKKQSKAWSPPIYLQLNNSAGIKSSPELSLAMLN